MQIVSFRRKICTVNAHSNPDPAAFRLGEVHVDVATGSVRGPEGEVRLEPRVMAVLAALTRKAGQLVSRAELLREVWPGGEVYDEALTQSVYQLRQQLMSAGGEEYRHQIATIPKRGYVFKGDVEPVVAEPSSVDSRQTLGRKRAGLAMLAVVAGLLAVWALMQSREGPGPSPTAPSGRTLAVLPFVPLTEDQHEPVLELGMADTLITLLSGIDQLVVRPMSSVRRFGDPERDSLEAGRQLRVDAVVDGSVQRSGDLLRVTVRLLRVADGVALWAETIDEPFGNIFEVQDEISARIAGALALELGQDVRRGLARGGTSLTAAYEHYLKGRYHLTFLTPQDLRASVEHFREAVSLDPGYAQAWLALANAQFRIPIAGEARPLEYYPLAREAANRALEIDPTLAEAYAMLGWITHWFEWDWGASEAYFQRAIQMNPNDTESHLGYAHVLSSSGRHDEALAEVRRARELSPNYMVAAFLEGGFLLQAQRPEEAVRRLEASRNVASGLWVFRINLASAYAALGRNEEALLESTKARELAVDSTYAMAIEAGILVELGRRPEAEALLHEMLQRSEERYVPPYNLAYAFMKLDDIDTALVWLERAYAERDPKLTFLPSVTWRQIADRPEYWDLLQRMGLRRAEQ